MPRRFELDSVDARLLRAEHVDEREERTLWGSKNPDLRVSDISDIQSDLAVTHNLPFTGVSKTELHAMVNRLNLLVDAGRVIVHPNCKLLIQTLKNGIWDKNREAFAYSEIGLGHMDAIASLVYMVMAFDSWFNMNPIPLAQSTFTNVDLHGVLAAPKSEWNKAFDAPKSEWDKPENELPSYDNDAPEEW